MCLLCKLCFSLKLPPCELSLKDDFLLSSTGRSRLPTSTNICASISLALLL